MEFDPNSLREQIDILDLGYRQFTEEEKLTTGSMALSGQRRNIMKYEKLIENKMNHINAFMLSRVTLTNKIVQLCTR